MLVYSEKKGIAEGWLWGFLRLTFDVGGSTTLKLPLHFCGNFCGILSPFMST